MVKSLPARGAKLKYHHARSCYTRSVSFKKEEIYCYSKEAYLRSHDLLRAFLCSLLVFPSVYFIKYEISTHGKYAPIFKQGWPTSQRPRTTFLAVLPQRAT